MNIDAAKEKVEEKKMAREQNEMEEYILDTIEYADACVELSIIAAEEATLATLEALAAIAEYDKTYGIGG